MLASAGTVLTRIGLAAGSAYFGMGSPSLERLAGCPEYYHGFLTRLHVDWRMGPSSTPFKRCISTRTCGSASSKVFSTVPLNSFDTALGWARAVAHPRRPSGAAVACAAPGSSVQEAQSATQFRSAPTPTGREWTGPGASQLYYTNRGLPPPPWRRYSSPRAP